MSKLLVSPKAFAAIQTVDAEELAKLSEKELRPLLPCLVRMSLCSPLDQSSEWSSKRKIILRLLSGIELVNTLVALLSIDFHALEVDVKKEQQLRMKLGGHSGESVLVSSLQNGPTLEFERSDAARKLRLLLSELLSIMSQVKESRADVIRHSELFDTEVFLEEVSDVLCIAKAELPGLLQMSEVAEALIRVKNGPALLCRLVANSPDCFREVCFSLISNGEKQDEETVLGRVRMQTLRMLCQMNMSQALTIRAKAVEMCCMPGLAVHLTLDHCPHEYGGQTSSNTIVGDLVAFISGLLLGSDDKVRSWFAQYVRNCQKKTEGAGSSTLQQLRDELLQRLQNLVLFHIDHHNLPDCKVVQASALLRLYCALRGIAGLKFNDSEINVLLQLLTSHPPPSPAGIRFVSLGLCMMMACPSLLNSAEHENRGKLWIQWLVKEESYFGRVSGVSASFGEMLLLIAIHFHSNQINSIADLVCSTLGMRIAIRSNNLVRMKVIFTQEIFTDQVVTAHAVKVPVTPDLSRNTAGFLPVHCIHQLLKSRAFTKHKVPIKDWIYKQICSTIPPLHPVLPALIEVYVNSVLIPSSKGTHDTTNEPITEEEILAVFKNSVFMPEEPSKATSKQYKTQDSEPMEVDEKPASLTSQLLLLYYLLLYEDTRLSNMKTIISFGRKVKKYSAEFISQLPIFYLLQQAQKNQQMYAGLFSPLLRLLATNFPHLCLVESWLAEEGNTTESEAPALRRNHKSLCSKITLNKAFEVVVSCPFQLFQLLEHLLSLPLCQLWPFASDFVSNLPKLLDPQVPRKILEKSKQVWWKLNTIFPRRLWLMTVSALQPNCLPSLAAKPLLLDNIILDPLHVLRCDKRIFRCAPLLEIVLHMLQAFLAASRTHLAHHMLEHPSTEKSGQIDGDKNREELRSALVAAQESAAVQILLECCRPTEEDKKCKGLLTELREVQSLICSHIHQVFISDPSLAKLVHFQGYPSELLSVTVSSIPSMHICLDFIPELLSQPHLDKQVFAIELASYLCIEYAIPKSLSIAKLCVNVAHTLLGVIPSEQQPILYVPALPSLVRMCKAFPPLCEDVASLLLQLGNVCLSRASVINSILLHCSDFPSEESDKTNLQEMIQKLPSNSTLSKVIRKSFAELCDIVVFNNTVY